MRTSFNGIVLGLLVGAFLGWFGHERWGAAVRCQ